jgi:hypothetical protein
MDKKQNPYLRFEFEANEELKNIIIGKVKEWVETKTQIKDEIIDSSFTIIISCIF